MSYKAKEQSGNSDVFPTSPTSDKSSSSLSPTSTLSRGKRKHRKGSDRGYGSTNSSLSESGRPDLYTVLICVSVCTLSLDLYAMFSRRRPIKYSCSIFTSARRTVWGHL
jgi:hypothetical protein